MNRLWLALNQMFRNYSLGQRIMIVVVLLGVVSSLVSLLLWANRPDYDVLYSNLDLQEAGRVVEGLQSLKVDYRLENGGRTILVPSNQVAELRVKLADKGVGTQRIEGYEIFDNQKLGMTTFMQRVNLRRALEGELERTINQFPAVLNCRVHLVIPEKKLFADESRGSASVVLELKPGYALSQDRVQGIAALVANSVEEIEPEDVVIVDTNGRLLSRGETAGGFTVEASKDWELRHQVEERLEQKVDDLLDHVVGPGNAVVRVAVELNFEKIERTRELYDPDNVVVVSEERHSSQAVGPADTAGTTPQKQITENVVTNYELNKTIEHYLNDAGEIKRLSVAVLVNGKHIRQKASDGQEVEKYVPLSSQELDRLASLVKSAVGYDETRGDIVEVQNMPFDKSQLEADKVYFKEARKQAMWAAILEKGTTVFGILLAFLLLRGLLKGGIKALSEMPVTQPAPSLPSGEHGTALESGEKEITEMEEKFIAKLSPEAQAKLKAKDRMTTEVVNYAKDRPEEAAKLIRSWLTQAK